MAAKPEDLEATALNRYLYDEFGIDGGRGTLALDEAPPLEVGFPEASAWRRLAWGVGHLLATGALAEPPEP